MLSQDPVQTQRLSAMGIKLASRADLKYVYIVPIDAMPQNSWGADPWFGLYLGRAASSFIAQELQTSMDLNRLQPPDDKNSKYWSRLEPTLRIGVSGGSTVYGLFESLELPETLMAPDCSIMPLVLGPIPETNYSAGLIAKIASDRLRCQLEEISTLKIDGTSLRIAIDETRVGARRKSINELLARPNGWMPVDEDPKKHLGTMNYDWIITGIGSRGVGQLDKHVTSIYAGNEPNGVIGDICSRLFDGDASEIDPIRQDVFVAIPFRLLEYLASTKKSRRRVIAVAGGRDKLPALLALMKSSAKEKKTNSRTKRLFNVLVTDELTAAFLLNELSSDA